jgi:hypothetical protein
MSNVRRLMPADDERMPFNTGEWDRRAQRFLRDLRMLGLGSPEIAEMLRDLLSVVEGKYPSRDPKGAA